MQVCNKAVRLADEFLNRDLSRYSRMVNTERLTVLSANLDCIELNIDTDSDDVGKCYEKCIKKVAHVYDRYMPLTPSTVKIRKLKCLG